MPRRTSEIPQAIQSEHLPNRALNRRKFLLLGASAVGLSLLAACEAPKLPSNDISWGPNTSKQPPKSPDSNIPNSSNSQGIPGYKEKDVFDKVLDWIPF